MVVTSGGGAPDILWVEARDATKYFPMHRTNPQHKIIQPKMSVVPRSLVLWEVAQQGFAQDHMVGW